MSLDMVLYPFVASLTLNPSTGETVGGATGSVFAKADTTFTTPLAAVDASGNPVTLTSNANGVLPSFFVDGYTAVNWKSGEWVFPLVTSEPVEGPEGPAGVSVNGATATGDDLVFSLSNGSTTPPVKLPVGAGGSDSGVASYITTPGTETAAALSATTASAIKSTVTDPARLNDVGATAALMQNLDAGGSSCAIQVLGDSTGVSTTRWVYLMAQYLAGKYPAFTVRHRFWNDGTQMYDAPTTLQTGPGGNRHAQFVAGQNAWLYITNSTALDITADLDVSVQVSLDDWTPATVQAIVGRFNSAGTRSWMLRVLTTGMLELTWSNDGTGTSAATSTVAPAVADGGTLWIRVTLDVDNGAAGRDIKFWTSTDGVAWTQLGATVTQAGVTTIFNAAYRMELGARSNGSDYLHGKVYEVRVRNGINGRTIVPVSPEMWESVTNAGGKITWGGAPVLDIINGSRSGANIYFLNDATRQPIMTPQYPTLLTFLSCSHNDSTRMGPQYLADWDNLLTTVKARLPMSSVVVVGQNPRNAPADSVYQHAARIAQLSSWATRNGARFLNVYRAFTDYLAANPTVTLASLLDSLGIHPTDAAYADVYFPAVRDMLERRS